MIKKCKYNKKKIKDEIKNENENTEKPEINNIEKEPDKIEEQENNKEIIENKEIIPIEANDIPTAKEQKI